MELKVSSPKPESVAPSDCLSSDPEEKEVSDDDDDDRNHKHRRREARSHSLERDVSEPVNSRSFRKRNKTFGNRHPFRKNDSPAFEAMRTYNVATPDKEFYSKFDRRLPGFSSGPRTPLGMRLRGNQPFTGDPGAGRGRGRESNFWNPRESRFSSIDVASQMVPQGSIPPALYTGRGLPNVSNSPSASWNTFGLLPPVPNGGGLDMLHPMGLPGTLRHPINPSLNVNIPRQRCRDFEERGFCLRGDMCPMEHGVNRIVIEDVQSLSQFNLPVSLPSAHLIGAPTGSGSLHSVNVPTTSVNNKSTPGKISKSAVGGDVLPLDGAYPGPGCTTGADLYDPDQPLWNDSRLEPSNALLTLQSSKIEETEPFPTDASDNDYPVGATKTSDSSQGTSSSVFGRIDGSKNRFDMKEKTNSTMSSFHYHDNQLKEDKDELVAAHSGGQRKQIIGDDDQKASDGSLKAQTDSMRQRHIRKPSQKALRTLFVNGIPQKNNRRETLLAHFQKFGEVIDIYIPLNSERAFVQFSKREEAEAALKAPDAVMGNRFIKLWWANRDSICSESPASGNGVIVTPRGQAPAFIPPHPVVTDKGKDIHQADASKANLEVSSLSDQSKPATDGAKVPPLQKKLENIEHLKEELRKKQEMLDQKRNEFRRQLSKLEKQASGVKCEVTEQAAKRPKTGTSSDVAKLAPPHSSDADHGSMTSPHAETTADKSKQLVNTVSQSPKASTSTTMRLQEAAGLKQPVQPLMPVNRYKLDNRPTAFRIIPPLPADLANVAVLKEHFVPYGDLSMVELEDLQVNGSSQQEAQQEAQVTFTTRRAAERAFLNGKCWKDHNLKFVWLTPSSNSSNADGGRERSLSTTTKEPSDKEEHSEEQPEKSENSANQEAIISDGEHKESEIKDNNNNDDIGLEHMEMEPGEEDQQSNPPRQVSAEESPDGNVS